MLHFGEAEAERKSRNYTKDFFGASRILASLGVHRGELEVRTISGEGA
jgi:hypothetical protein